MVCGNSRQIKCRPREAQKLSTLLGSSGLSSVAGPATTRWPSGRPKEHLWHCPKGVAKTLGGNSSERTEPHSRGDYALDLWKKKLLEPKSKPDAKSEVSSGTETD